MSEWISVKDRLPKEQGHYLVTIENKRRKVSEVDTSYFEKKHKDWYIIGELENVGSYDYKVTAWMPLPEPYKKSEVQSE